MTNRKNVFFESNGITIRGWLYFPHHLQAKLPCIIMAHGFSALKEHYLDKFAKYFIKNENFAVLVFDNPCFGDSDGEPRQEVNPTLQLQAYRDAISYVELLAEIDSSKIGAWGTSFSGGHVLALGALDKRVKCIVSQVPFIGGELKAFRVVKPEDLIKRKAAYERDKFNKSLNKTPEMIQVVLEDKTKTAVMKSLDAYQFFKSVSKWKNSVTLHSLELVEQYEPHSFIKNIIETPVLYIVSKSDLINPTDLALEAYQKTKTLKKLVLIEGGHFSSYVEEFNICARSALLWFETYLV
jgi:fermentation-respiration switch protein FrsA (DUF1100 family)